MKKPEAQEVYDYMLEKGVNNYEEAESFIDHYEMVGWVVGKARTPMKKWKSAVNVWLRNSRKWSKTNEKRQQPNQTHSQRQHQQAQDAHLQMELEHTEGNARFIR